MLTWHFSCINLLNTVYLHFEISIPIEKWARTKKCLFSTVYCSREKPCLLPCNVSAKIGSIATFSSLQRFMLHWYKMDQIFGFENSLRQNYLKAMLTEFSWSSFLSAIQTSRQNLRSIQTVASYMSWNKEHKLWWEVLCWSWWIPWKSTKTRDRFS